ncbi:hypothetical protein CR513_36932, partial [Mucuna pruriens]
MEDNHFGQDRIKGLLQLNNSDPQRMRIRDKQLATSNLEFQQSVSSNNMKFQQNMTATIQDLKTQIG